MDCSSSDASAVRDTARRSVMKLIPHAFLTMANVEAVIGTENPECSIGNSRRSVAGVIGWVGSLSGTGILECSPEFACILANLMLGTEETSLSEDALDAVAEMTNIVFGGMKTELERCYGMMALSIPTIVYGTDVEMRTSGELIAVLPIGIGEHSLRVKVYMNRQDERRSALSQFWTISCAAKP